MKKNTKDYSKVFTELDEIFRYLPDEMLRKIPARMKKVIRENKNKEYEFYYDESKELMNQDIYMQTKDFLAIIYITFMCNKDDKERILRLCRESDKKIIRFRERLAQQNRENLFSSKRKVEKQKPKEETALVVSEKNWFTKLLNKIKSFFKKV